MTFTVILTSGITAPGAVRNLAITGRTGNSIAISFDAPTSNGGSCNYRL